MHQFQAHARRNFRLGQRRRLVDRAGAVGQQRHFSFRLKPQVAQGAGKQRRVETLDVLDTRQAVEALKLIQPFPHELARNPGRVASGRDVVQVGQAAGGVVQDIDQPDGLMFRAKGGVRLKKMILNTPENEAGLFDRRVVVHETSSCYNEYYRIVTSDVFAHNGS